MKTFSSLCFLTLLTLSSANHLNGVIKKLNKHIEKAEKMTEKIAREPKNQLVLKTGVSTPPPNVYYPQEHNVIEKKEPIVMKKLCKFPIGKEDILMVNLVKKQPYQPAVGLPPIILDNQQVELSFYVEKGSGYLKQLKAMFKFNKGQLGGDALPLHLQLDRKMLGSLPPPSPDDIFILTIIKTDKRGRRKVASHFIDVISTEQEKYPY